jgi:voltage-gated potassium channel
LSTAASSDSEGWSLLDAFYFSSITLTTIGYGDLFPQTAAGKLFAASYIFTGLGIIVAFVNAVARYERARNAHRRHRSRRLLAGTLV